MICFLASFLAHAIVLVACALAEFPMVLDVQAVRIPEPESIVARATEEAPLEHQGLLEWPEICDFGFAHPPSWSWSADDGAAALEGVSPWQSAMDDCLLR